MTACRFLAGLAAAAAALALGGCISASDVAQMIVTAPNKDGHSSPYGKWMRQMADAFYVRRLEVTVGPPAATLATAIIAPRNYRFSASAKWKKSPVSLDLDWQVHNSKIGLKHPLEGKKAGQYMLRMAQDAIPKLPICRATGTVILLPGWGESKETLLGYALDFANHGYRVVLVDLRGQGQSSGKYVTYGLIEHRDISQLITALYQRHLVAGKLALVGISEGATIALDTAAADRRIAAVVAVAPFVNLKTAIRGVGNFFMPNVSKAVSKQKLAKALVIADRRVGMNLAAADPSTRVRQIKAPVLYIAGGKDKIAPAVDVKALAAKTPNGDFLEIPRYPHLALYFGVATVAPPALAALALTMGQSPDPACLAKPPPPDARYTFSVSVTLHKR